MSISCVSFDAGFTLLEPVVSVPRVYHGEALALGAQIDFRPFADHVAVCWRRLNSDFRSAHPDLCTSEEIERAQWRTFTAEVAAPFPELVARHETWHARLVAHFDRPGSWELVAGVEETLSSLRERGLGLAVTSNWHRALHGILAGLEIENYFDQILTSADAGRKKPHAEIFRLACKQLGALPEETLHLGDSLDDDFEGARAAGLHALLFDPRDRETMKERIREFPELLDLLQGA